MSNPNNEPLVTVTIGASVTLPTLVAASTGLGAFAGPHHVAGEVVMVPVSVAAWLLARGAAVVAP